MTTPSRRERFQSLYAALNPVGGPDTLQFFVSRPVDSVSQRIASELAVVPQSQHLLYSAIGAGKTTEILAARAALAERDPTLFTAWVDPPSLDDRMGTHWFVDWALFALATELHQRGKTDNPLLKGVVEPWLVAPSKPSFAPGPASRDATLTKLVEAAGGTATVFIDSVERCTNLGALREALRDDLPLLAKHRVGVVAPRPFLLQPLHDSDTYPWSAQQHFVPAASLDDPEQKQWLRDIIAKRDPDGLFEKDAVEALAEGSGGVIRLLIVLARDSASFARQVSASTISAKHVKEALSSLAPQFPGLLSPSDAAALAHLDRDPTTNLGSEFWDHVLASRVLWRPDAPTKAVVHPLVRMVLQRSAA